VDSHPEYLTITRAEALTPTAIVNSISKGLDNVKEIIAPLVI
jgi:hypothetical protein